MLNEVRCALLISKAHARSPRIEAGMLKGFQAAEWVLPRLGLHMMCSCEAGCSRVSPCTGSPADASCSSNSAHTAVWQAAPPPHPPFTPKRQQCEWMCPREARHRAAEEHPRYVSACWLPADRRPEGLVPRLRDPGDPSTPPQKPYSPRHLLAVARGSPLILGLFPERCFPCRAVDIRCRALNPEP